jgi:hypothetical protein
VQSVSMIQAVEEPVWNSNWYDCGGDQCRRRKYIGLLCRSQDTCKDEADHIVQPVMLDLQ